MYNNVLQNKPKYSTEFFFFSSINLNHLTHSFRQTDIVCADCFHISIYILSYFRKKRFTKWKFYEFFVCHEPLISTLNYLKEVDVQGFYTLPIKYKYCIFHHLHKYYNIKNTIRSTQRHFI